MPERISTTELYDNRNLTKQICDLRSGLTEATITNIRFSKEYHQGENQMHLIVDFEDETTKDIYFNADWMVNKITDWGFTTEFTNEGNALYISQRDENDNEKVFAAFLASGPEINIDLHGENDKRSFLTQTPDGAYIQYDNEAGGRPRDNQKIMRRDDAIIVCDSVALDTSSMTFSGEVSQANYDRLSEGRLMLVFLKDGENYYGSAFLTTHHDYTTDTIYATGLWNKIDGQAKANVISLTFSGLTYSGKIEEIGGGGSGGATWGGITGTLSDQTDLNDALGDVNARVDAVEDELGSAGESGTIRGDISTLDHDLNTLKTTVGDSSSGLVKSVDDLGTDIGNLNTSVGSLETAVGDSSSGLVKDVGDLKTTVGDSSSGLVKGVADNADEIATLKAKGWKTPTTAAEVFGAQYGVLLALKCYVDVTPAPSSWTTAPSTPTIETSSKVEKYALYNKTDTIETVIPFTIDSEYLCIVDIQYNIFSQGFHMVPRAFNAGGCVAGSTTTVTETNFSTYFDLSRCLIWTEP